MHDLSPQPSSKNPQPSLQGEGVSPAYFRSNAMEIGHMPDPHIYSEADGGMESGVQEKITKSVDRITGIDIARALCVLGMVIAHFTSQLDPSNGVTTILSTVNGRASLTFVFVAGIGVTLLDRAKGPRESGITLLWRAAVLIPMGLLIQEVSPGPVLILQFYAVYYLVAWVGARLPTPLLYGLIPIWTGLGCWLWWYLRLPLTISSLTMSISEQVKIVLVSGQYPVITWAPMVLLGVLVGRLDLRNRQVYAPLAIGAALVIIGTHGLLAICARVSLSTHGVELPEWLILTAHSNSLSYLIEGYASAVLLVSLCLIVEPYLGKVGKWLAIAGRQALTLYVVHMAWFVILNQALDLFYLVSPLYTDPSSTPDLLLWQRFFEAASYLAAFVCFALLLLQAVVWNCLVGMGPLERLLRRPSIFRA